MKNILLATAALMTLSFTAQADVKVNDATTYETTKAMKAGAVFLGLHSDIDDKLVSASSTAADKVEIHSMVEEKGVMQMRKLDKPLDLPKDKTVQLEPGGYHLMLIGLKRPLKAGTEIPVSLVFEKARPQTLTAKVLSRSQPAGGAPAMDMQHHDH